MTHTHDTITTNDEHHKWIASYRMLSDATQAIAAEAEQQGWQQAYIVGSFSYFSVTVEIENGQFVRAIFRTHDGVNVAIRSSFNSAVDTLYCAMTTVYAAAAA